MIEQTWCDADNYLGDLLVLHDAALDAASRFSIEAGLPSIQVSAPQGKMLRLFAKMLNARSILELGTLGGYSTLWLAGALPPDGHLVTIEFDPHHAEVARRNFKNAGVESLIDLRLGDARYVLQDLRREGSEPFDFIFIDAEKEQYPEYLPLVLDLCRKGTLIIADNVVRNGAIADSETRDSRVAAVQRFLEMLAADSRVSATAIQTVGSKGYDGFAIALVVGS